MPKGFLSFCQISPVKAVKYCHFIYLRTLCGVSMTQKETLSFQNSLIYCLMLYKREHCMFSIVLLSVWLTSQFTSPQSHGCNTIVVMCQRVTVAITGFSIYAIYFKVWLTTGTPNTFQGHTGIWTQITQTLVHHCIHHAPLAAYFPNT